ncbi:unnamed protein product [Closterium sp. Yama58-4]|nr:unnamed protein product [Closterium sp. Yama58-4]
MTAAGAELAEVMAESGTMGPAALLTDRQIDRLSDCRFDGDGDCGSGGGGAGAVSARQRFPDFAEEGLPRGAPSAELLNPGAVTLPLFHVREGFCASFSAPGGRFGAPASSARLRRRVAAPAFAPFLKAASAPPAAEPLPSSAASAPRTTGSAPPTVSSVQAAPLSSTAAFKLSLNDSILLPAYSRSAPRTRSASSATSSAPPAHLRSPDLVAPQSLPARPTSPTPTLPPSPARQAPHFAPLPERKAPPALSPARPHELHPADLSAGRPAVRPRRLPAVHALADGALALLVPLAGTGPQVLQMLGGPAAWVRRFVMSVGLAVALYSVSVVAAVTAAFYWAWWPIWRAAAKNLAMRIRYRHAGLWKARLLDLQVVRVGRQTRWRVLIGDHSRTTLEMDVVPPHKSVCLRRGDPVELLVLSDCPSLSRFRAAREIFFPQRSLWLVGDKQACVERSVFEEMRRKVALRAAVEDGEDSEGEDWDGLYSLLTDENEQLLQNYSYNEASSMQAEMEGGGGKGIGGSLGGGLPGGVGGFEGVAGGMSGGGASLGGITSFSEDLGVKEGQELLPHQGLLDYSAMEGPGSGGFRDPALVSSFGGGGGSVGAVADGLAASSSCLMDGGGSGPLSVLLSDGQDSELLERLREV